MTTKRNPYLLFFRNTGPETHAHLSPEQRQQLMTRWNAWYDELAAEGKAVEGQPLELHTRVVSGAGGSRVVDGPYAEAKEAIGGYVKLVVSGLDEATEIAQRHPGLEYGLVIEVREFTDTCHLGVTAGQNLSSALDSLRLVLPDQADPLRDEMSVPATRASRLVEHFFRHETGRLHGALIRLLGVHNLALAEDVAQEAMLRALRTWSMGGVPDNPSAWITRVAMNLAKDTLRHHQMSAGKEDAIITHLEQTIATPTILRASDFEIRDDALRLMLVCCHPSIPADAQVVLALKVLCGFSTGEIARAFLSSEAAIEKQLTRTKHRIQKAGIGFDIPEGEDVGPRLDGVLAVLYLLFNEGYKASAGESLLREELCQEAIRLTALLVAHPTGNTPRSHALLALMLFTSARFPTRVDEDGDLLRLDDQDRSKWDQSLIERGLVHLAEAARGDHVSEYHQQAGIAGLHCTAVDHASTDWARILRHYDALNQLKPSPIIALNRAVVISYLQGPQAALNAIAEIPHRDRLGSHYLLHAVVGELHWRLHDNHVAAESFRRALHLAEVRPEQLYLTKMLERSSGVTSNSGGIGRG